MADDGSSTVCNNTTNWAGLKGWALIEQFMTDLDTGMVNDYNDDINTLLTFAGLFSAVLTAFLIESYKWLQLDSSTTTNQALTQISQQIANSSLAPVNPQAAQEFEPALSSVWINTLWFLALVLSLAAALFGMMAKQWLRQYLRWTTMSRPSEIQVQLRQIRYEAFHDWKMPAIIASIPALLEIALILFLVGMDVLLWTLNGIVFGVCTVAIAVLVVLAFVTTILPVFCPRCPYKSPAGWACLLVLQTAGCLWNRSMDLLEQFLDSLVKNRFIASDHHTRAARRWDNWRERDLSLGRSALDIQIYDADGDRIVDRGANMQVFSRALGWVRGTSQDTRLLNALKDCIPFPPAVQDVHPISSLILHFHAACQMLDIDLTSLVPPEQRCAVVADGADVIAIDHIWEDGDVEYNLLTRDGCWQRRLLTLRYIPSTPSSLRVQLAHTIANYLLAILDIQRDGAERVMCGYSKQAAYYLQASALLGVVLPWTAISEERHAPAAMFCFATLLERLFSNGDVLPLHFMSLVPSLFRSMRRYEDMLDRRLFLVSAGDLRLTRTALKLPYGDPVQWDGCYCAFFVCVSQDALKEWYAPCDPVQTQATLPQLLDRMATCAERSLALGLDDSGVHSIDFCWPARLRGLFDPSYEGFQGHHISQTLFPHRFIQTLARCKDAALISSWFDSESIEALLRHSRELQSLPHPIVNDYHSAITTADPLTLNGTGILPTASLPCIASAVPAVQDEPPCIGLQASASNECYANGHVTSSCLSSSRSASLSDRSVSPVLQPRSGVDYEDAPSSMDTRHSTSLDTEDTRSTAHVQ